MNERDRARRNLNPHAEAIAARFLWGYQYAAQRGGTMDFWDSLTEHQKALCRELVDRVLDAPRAPQKD